MAASVLKSYLLEPFDTSTAEGLTPIAHLLDPYLTRSFAAPFPTTLSTTVAN